MSGRSRESWALGEPAGVHPGSVPEALWDAPQVAAFLGVRVKAIHAVWHSTLVHPA